MDARTEHRNKKDDKAKRNKGFPYKKLKLREEWNFNEGKRNERATEEERSG